MSPEAQRIALAGACGIHVCPSCNYEIDPEICHCGDPIKSHGYACGHTPIPLGCVCGYDPKTVIRLEEPECPNFLGDLNDTQEAVTILTELSNAGKSNFSLTRYWEYLRGRHGWGGAIDASAANRVEALLRVLNLWDDSK